MRAAFAGRRLIVDVCPFLIVGFVKIAGNFKKLMNHLMGTHLGKVIFCGKDLNRKSSKIITDIDNRLD